LSAIHQHLVREGLRTTAGLVVETGTAREVHHFAVLAGYGAEAVHPYLAMETLVSMHKDLPGDLSAEKAIYNYVKAVGKGPVQDHVQDGREHLHELLRRPAVRGHRPVNSATVAKYFTGTPSRVEGIGVFEIAEEAIRMHKAAFGRRPGAGHHAGRRRRICLAHAR
jgi:glutamate synthase (NADPH/NADH) large chain